jgi:hypothetical protein
MAVIVYGEANEPIVPIENVTDPMEVDERLRLLGHLLARRKEAKERYDEALRQVARFQVEAGKAGEEHTSLNDRIRKICGL